MTFLTKKQWQRGAAALLAMVMVLAIAACNPHRFKVKAAQLSQIVVRTPGEPKTFNYALIQEAPNVSHFIHAGLIAENEKGELEPDLAESWQFSEDKQRIIVTLRQGLKWSDGQPLTVEDVMFSYQELYFNEKIPLPIRDSFRIGAKGALPTIRKLNDRQVEFITPEPFAPFLRTTGAAILPAHALRAIVNTKDAKGQSQFLTTWGVDTDPNQIVVNGPYRIESYTTSQRLVLRRNPYYWKKDVQGQPLPYIDRVVWQIVESSDTGLIQFRSGGLDALAIGSSSFSLLKREEKRGNFTIYNGGPDSGTTFVCFNLNQGKRKGKPVVDPIKSRWFNTVAFRQAVAYALDRQTMINNTFRGLGQLQDSPISVQSPYYLSPQEGLKIYPYDLEKAKTLLLGAGFKYDSAGQLFDAQGNRVRFTMLSQTGSRIVESLAAQIKGNLNKVGIQVDYAPLDFSALLDKVINTFEWEFYIGGITGSVEPNNGYNIWSPDGSFHPFNQKPQAGQAPLEGRVVADWEAKIGQLYIQGARELDEAKRKEIYGETQRLAQEYLPFIHLVNPLNMVAVRNRVQDVKIASLYYESLLWNVAKLKVQTN